MMTSILPHDEKAHSFFVGSGGLVAFFAIQEKKSAGIYMTTSVLDEAEFNATLKKINHALGNVKDIQVKLVGTTEFVEKITALLKKLNISVFKAVVREPNTQVIFRPKELRLQVSKEDEPIEKRLGKVKVLIVDDSKTIRQLLTKILSSDPEIEVVGAVDRPSLVEDCIKKTHPDVITLDIHMPEMDGVTLLGKLLPKYRIPTVMVTSISMEESTLVLSALEMGAVDYIQKPTLDQLDTAQPLIIEKVKFAALAKLQSKNAISIPATTFHSKQDLDLSRVIAIGASTGGVEALRAVLTSLPAVIPPIVIVQHIPPVFSKAFAMRMNDLCEFEVKEAQDGDELRPGRVIIAAGGTQMKVKQKGSGYCITCDDSPPVNRHKPSVDVLFDTVAEVIGAKAMGVILTGMGADGAKGLLKMKNAGSHTIAQDQESCVVFGMPREAIKLGGAVKVGPLSQIPQLILDEVSKKNRNGKAS